MATRKLDAADFVSEEQPQNGYPALNLTSQARKRPEHARCVTPRSRLQRDSLLKVSCSVRAVFLLEIPLDLELARRQELLSRRCVEPRRAFPGRWPSTEWGRF